jgi:hypothetical protein
MMFFLSVVMPNASTVARLMPLRDSNQRATASFSSGTLVLRLDVYYGDWEAQTDVRGELL